MNLFNWFKQLFVKKKVEKIKSTRDLNDFDGDYIEFVNISTISFLDETLVQSIYQDLIILIVNNNFIIDPSKILAFFKRHYNFTDNEFFVLSFKLGMITKMYSQDPVILLSSALKLKDIFSKEKLKDLRIVLKNQESRNEDAFNREHLLFKTSEEEKEFKKKLDADDPDALIDNWLRKNKKK